MWRSTDLALDRDPSSRFLTGLLAVMVFLGALAVSGALMARGFVGDWSAALGARMTVQIPPVLGIDDRDPVRAERRDAVLRLLRVTPGVAAARPVDEAEAEALVRPWLGHEMLARLPMPVLIDIRLDPAQPLDLESLRTRLENAAPGTVLDDHGRWVAEARALSASVTVAAGAVLLLVVTAAVLAVVFAVRTGVTIHRNEIQILSLIGAPDRYIARQFETQAARSALFGGLFGAVLALATVVGIAVLSDRQALPALGPAAVGADIDALLPVAGALGAALPDPAVWLALAATPAGAIAISILAARIAVHRALATAP